MTSWNPCRSHHSNIVTSASPGPPPFTSCRLEETSATNGIPMEEIWEELFKERMPCCNDKEKLMQGDLMFYTVYTCRFHGGDVHPLYMERTILQCCVCYGGISNQILFPTVGVEFWNPIHLCKQRSLICVCHGNLHLKAFRQLN